MPGEPLPGERMRERLAGATRTEHAALDRALMAARPFADRARYGGYLRVQQALHADAVALYACAELADLVHAAGIAPRLPQVEADLADLDLAIGHPPAGPAPEDMGKALGRLYVIEGSRLGARHLLQAARRLGLHETFGARHLAPDPRGVDVGWRAFVVAMGAREWTEAMAEGARDGFAFARQVVDAVFAGERADGAGLIGAA
ncbi:biliverdin-producing heme oxygenase [Ancylobacter terrae]|uniref:biliverdin-producing heme oxygenase n=1 Tax=Ancylobacter sp. sgz301288 TaxID=3342077 RepID=UPI00385F25B0